MAQVIEDFDFSSTRSGGNRSEHPWEDWSNGDTWKIVQGEDFTCTVKKMRDRIYNRRGDMQEGARVQTAVVDGGKAIVFRFYEA